MEELIRILLGQYINKCEIEFPERNYIMNKKLRDAVASTLYNEHYSLSDGSCTRGEITNMILKTDKYECLFESIEVTKTAKIDEVLSVNEDLIQTLSTLYKHLKNENEALKILKSRN